MENKKLILFTLLATLFISSAAFSQKAQKKPAIPGVAVVNFTNNSGNSEMKHYSTSLPEAISTALSQSDGIRLVERENMSKVLNEIELQMTGMFDPDDAAKVGKMAKAEVLIIGSYSGNDGNIVLSIKAVEVSSGKILDGRTVQGSHSQIIDKSIQAALSMAAIISGKNIGYLGVSTNPDGCDVYVDSMFVGKSPIVDLKVVAGNHRVVAVKEGYIDAEATLTIRDKAHDKWMPTLPDKANLDRAEWAVAAWAYLPFTSKAQFGPLFSFSMGKTFEMLYLGGEFQAGYIQNNQDLKTVFGTVEHERRYVPFLLGLHLNYTPFQNMRYFSPYAGIFGKVGRIYNYHKVEGKYEDDPELKAAPIYAAGAAVGINLIPYSKVSLFAEGRFYYVASIKRYEFVPNTFGATTTKESTINLSGIAIGFGLKYYF